MVVNTYVLPKPTMLLFGEFIPDTDADAPVVEDKDALPLALFIAYTHPELGPFFDTGAPMTVPDAGPVDTARTFESPTSVQVAVQDKRPEGADTPVAEVVPDAGHAVIRSPTITQCSFITVRVVGTPEAVPVVSNLTCYANSTR